MALDSSIFQDEEREEREEKYKRPEYAFVLRNGMQVKRKPVSLAKWRVLTAGEETAKGVAELYGGTPELFDATKEHDWAVMTESAAVEIVIDGSSAIEDKLIKWNSLGLPEHECDGVNSLLPEDNGGPCDCPRGITLKERKELHRKGKGPGPGIIVSFRLAGLGYELGMGKFIGQSWLFAETIHDVKDDLDDVDGEALCRLEIEQHEFTNSEGELIKYKKPVITVLGSYADAIAEER
jgi:hypothetical protein